MQTGILLAALKEQGIPVMKKTRGASQVLTIVMGFTYKDVEIYVPSQLYEKAREVLTVITGANLDNSYEE